MLSFLHAAADLFLGAACPSCAQPGWGVCAGCRALLGEPPEPIDRGLDVPLIAARQYRPILERVIPRYKDDGALYLDRFLGELLTEAVATLRPAPGTLLVPVPSRPAAVRQRGYDHARRLAAGAAGRLPGLGWRPLLTRRTAGQDQSGLGKADRARNLAGSMRAKPASAPVVVVDDVATSGASLREAIRALREAGVSVVGAAVVAQAEKLPRHSAKQ